MNKIYLDYAATTPTDPEVIRAMEPYFYQSFGNPSSPHAIGREARKAVEDARAIVSHFLGAQSDEIIFTSGGTESNNHALIGAARRLKDKGHHLIVSRIEHPSILEAVSYLQKEGFLVTFIDVDRYGSVEPQAIQEAIGDQTILIALMHANNEIGTLQAVSEIGKITRAQGVHFHVDAVQSVGHIPVKVDEIGCDTLSLAAHKFYGPKGVGALYIRQGTRVANYLLGGDQERGRRASTENVPGIVGLRKAIELCQRHMPQERKRQTDLRDRLISEVPTKIDECYLNGHPTQRLPNNAHFSFSSLEGESLLVSLDMIGIAASMGSACTSGALEPSHVLKAIGLSDELALGSLRITIGRWTQDKDIDYFLEQLPEIVRRLRGARL